MPDLSYHTELDWQERALHYGDGLFETLLKSNHRLPLWDAHFKRLRRGCERLSIPVPDEDWLRQRTLKESQHLDNAVIKIIISRGRGGRGQALPAASSASVFVLCYPWSKLDRIEINATICQTRLPLNVNLAGIKHLNRLDYVLAALELPALADVAEGILCDTEGFLVEGLISNLFFVSQSRIYTPSLDYAGVAGIMRQQIIEYCRISNIPLIEGRFEPQLLLAADECFLSNSVRGIRPLTMIDQQHYAVGQCTRELMNVLNPNMDPD